jgi:hypothetical protein
MATTKKRNQVSGFRISSPADFCSALGAHSHSIAIWVKLRGEREQSLRHTLDEIFKDLPFVDAQDPESVNDFLNGIELPLESLFDLKVQLFVIRAGGKKTFPAVDHRGGKLIADWEHNSYIVAPDPAFFWIESDDRPRIVHMLTASCREGLSALTAYPEDAIRVSPTVKHLSGAFEGEIPWCPLCYLEKIRNEAS